MTNPAPTLFPVSPLPTLDKLSRTFLKKNAEEWMRGAMLGWSITNQRCIIHSPDYFLTMHERSPGEFFLGIDSSYGAAWLPMQFQEVQRFRRLELEIKLEQEDAEWKHQHQHARVA